MRPQLLMLKGRTAFFLGPSCSASIFSLLLDILQISTGNGIQRFGLRIGGYSFTQREMRQPLIHFIFHWIYINPDAKVTEPHVVNVKHI